MLHFLMRVVLLSPVLALAPLGVAAEIGSERFAISLGAFITNRGTETRVDSNTLGRGTTIVLEDDLGLDSSQTVFRLDGHYRITERHRLDFSLFDLSRDATHRIVRDIQYGDEIFMADATVSSDFDLAIYKLAYSYPFRQTDQGFVGVDVGLHVADVRITLDEPSIGQFESSSLTAPLPVVGIRGEYYFGPRLALSGNVEWFGIKINDIEGRLLDIYAGLDYKITEKLALGVAYNFVTFDIDARRSKFDGSLDWDYDGFLLYFKAAFGTVRKSAAK